MQGTLRVRGLDAAKPKTWQMVFQGDNPAELDHQADTYRERLGVANVQLEVKFSRNEKAKLTRAVLQRDQHQCRKCAKTVDVQVVSMRHEEYHNPDRLVALCRTCRHARKITLDDPYDEIAVRHWLSNGRTGIKELVEDLQKQYPDNYAEIVKLAGAEGAAEFAENMIILTAFGGNPFLHRGVSPQLVKALEEHGKRDPIPDSFLDSDDDSG
jgi:hypothetical protein